MRQLKLWLAVHDIEILTESIQDGRAYFNLRLPSGVELPYAFREDAIESDPESAIKYLEMIVSSMAASD